MEFFIFLHCQCVNGNEDEDVIYYSNQRQVEVTICEWLPLQETTNTYFQTSFEEWHVTVIGERIEGNYMNNIVQCKIIIENLLLTNAVLQIKFDIAGIIKTFS